MTEHIVGQAKNYESDTIPGDFATLDAPCPKCGGEVHEKYKKFQCMNRATSASGRSWAAGSSSRTKPRR